MNSLLDLQHKIMTNSAAMSRLTMALAEQPDSLIIQANLRSLRKLYGNLRAEFDGEARKLGMDICSYRMLEDNPTARALSQAIGSFQDAFSLVFESLRSGPMQRRSLTRDLQLATDLHIAYTFPGSFGIMLTIPRQRLLFPDWATKSDEAIDIVFGVTKSRTPKELAQVARQVGTAPIAALYNWAKGNAQNKTGASVEWNYDTPAKRDVLVQYPEFAELYESIEETSDEKTETIEYQGSLVGADTKTRRFHFVTLDDQDIRGRFTNAISETQKAQLPAKYIAKVQVKTKVNFAKGEDEISYDLLALTAVE